MNQHKIKIRDTFVSLCLHMGCLLKGPGAEQRLRRHCPPAVLAVRALIESLGLSDSSFQSCYCAPFPVHPRVSRGNQEINSIYLQQSKSPAPIPVPPGGFPSSQASPHGVPSSCATPSWATRHAQLGHIFTTGHTGP